jgi:hypothetical protein
VLGVRYVVVAERAAPERTGAEEHPVPGGVPATLARQLDLRRLEVDPSLTFYENTAWVPGRASIAAEAADVLDESDGLRAAAGTDLAAAADPVLVTDGANLAEGTVYLAESTASGWELTVDGDVVERSRALGFANQFDVDPSGPATLRYKTSPLRWLAVLLQVALWVAVLAYFVLDRRRRRAGDRGMIG